MDKVDELVEWVAKELHYYDWDCEVSMAYNYGGSGVWEEQDDVLHQFYLNRAKQLLSHPDLALIDRENPNTCMDCAGVYVIPLADALKEKNGQEKD